MNRETEGTEYRDRQGRPNPYPPGTMLHAHHELRLNVDDLLLAAWSAKPLVVAVWLGFVFALLVEYAH